MALDLNSVGPAALSRSTLDRLHLALERYARSAEPDGALQAALAEVGGEARARGIPPERVLVELKQVWNRLPHVRRLEKAPSPGTGLQRVVTMCIKAYFR